MRLSLRYDNADQRLTPLAHEIGSVGQSEFRAFQQRRRDVERVKDYLAATRVNDLGDDFLAALRLEGSEDAYRGKRLDYLARRPDCSQEKLVEAVARALAGEVADKEVIVALNDLRYSGYLKDQESLARKRGHYDGLEIPSDVEFARISGLSNEVVQKLSRVRPRTIGQAARIPGVTPAAVSILLIALLNKQAVGAGGVGTGL